MFEPGYMPERCGCGDNDPDTDHGCTFLDFGYPYCSGCGEHHRMPVATEAEPWCPIDCRAAVEAEVDKLPVDQPYEWDVIAAGVRERFIASPSAN